MTSLRPFYCRYPVKQWADYVTLPVSTDAVRTNPSGDCLEPFYRDLIALFVNSFCLRYQCRVRRVNNYGIWHFVTETTDISKDADKTDCTTASNTGWEKHQIYKMHLKKGEAFFREFICMFLRVAWRGISWFNAAGGLTSAKLLTPRKCATG